jgi:arylsulfatase A-like enzyme
LETLGLHTNTIVVLWGDHGFHLGDHGEWAKHTNLEQAARVPLIIYSPFAGVAGATVQSPANFVDIYPTLCELAGLPLPQQPLNEHEAPFDPAFGRALKGTSLVPVMQDPAVSLRTGALTVFRRDGAMGYAYRTARYRYVEWVDISSNTVVARELYDYEQDPLETVNLAARPDYGGLMYQYSVSMRTEMDNLKLSPADMACTELQGSPPLDTAAEPYLVGLKASITGSDLEISWPDGEGWDYNVMTKSALTNAMWVVEQGGIPGDSAALVADESVAFFRVELAL